MYIVTDGIHNKQNNYYKKQLMIKISCAFTLDNNALIIYTQ